MILFIHHSELDIFKMASRMVADKFHKPKKEALPVDMSDGFVTDQMPYLIKQHFTN